MVEDRQFNPEVAKATRHLGPSEFWQRLKASQSTHFREIFGDEFYQPASGNAALPEGSGTGSLGFIAPVTEPKLTIRDYQNGPRLRIQVTDGELDLDAAVTDIRFFSTEGEPRKETVQSVNGRIQAGAECVLSVGVGHPYPPSEPQHWLQVNGIHLADDPLWDVKTR